MKIGGILVKETGEIIYSRARHDFRWDSTHKYAVDGGQEDYHRRVFESEDGFREIVFDLPVSAEELYEDWRTGSDKYGVIGPMELLEYTIIKRR